MKKRCHPGCWRAGIGWAIRVVVACLAVSAANAADSGGPRSAGQARPPKNEADLKFWLRNMRSFHHFTDAEIQSATGLSPDEVQRALRKYRISEQRPSTPRNRIVVLPYPGGRHPRIGFLEGAINPQRETKVSVFTPWDPTSYVVVDVPEAIWWEDKLLYLAHTHIPTIWDQPPVTLDQLEWKTRGAGGWQIQRRLPNNVTFGAVVVPEREGVRMELWLHNGSTNRLTNLRVQNCVMLKGAAGFTGQTNSNKILEKPYAVARSTDNRRFAITAWQLCQRVWANAPVPCVHSDPRFPDCAPGETQRLRGWLSFYEGDDLAGELRRLEHERADGWGHTALP